MGWGGMGRVPAVALGRARGSFLCALLTPSFTLKQCAQTFLLRPSAGLVFCCGMLLHAVFVDLKQRWVCSPRAARRLGTIIITHTLLSIFHAGGLGGCVAPKKAMGVISMAVFLLGLGQICLLFHNHLQAGSAQRIGFRSEPRDVWLDTVQQCLDCSTLHPHKDAWQFICLRYTVRGSVGLLMLAGCPDDATSVCELDSVRGGRALGCMYLNSNNTWCPSPAWVIGCVCLA